MADDCPVPNFTTAKIFSGGASTIMADFNGDGKLDLVGLKPVEHPNSHDMITPPSVSVLSNGDGTFGNARFLLEKDSPQAGNNPRAGLALDVDGDGNTRSDYRGRGVPNPTFYCLITSGGIRILIGNGDGAFGQCWVMMGTMPHPPLQRVISMAMASLT